MFINGKIPNNPFKYTIDGKEVSEEIFIDYVNILELYTNYNLEVYPKLEKKKKLEQNASYDEILTHIPRID